MKVFIKTFIKILIIISVGVSLLNAQDSQFGKNKVQYKNFDWYYIQTAHFDVYFTKGGDDIANFTADVAETSYYSISKSFRYQTVNRIPIIVYNSHNEFQQTNVVNEYLEEGIGGVTELFKNRVVVPFEGDYKKFRHVIHHELVHGVINDMFYGGSIQSIISNNITLQLPLWFNEGLAEYEALKWDTDSDMFLRDATIHEYLPKIDQLYGYFAYRGGQSVWNYIATKYGEQKIGEILNRIRGSHNVNQGFRSAIGLSTEELSERWQKEQKVLYWPDIAKRTEPADFAKKLTDHTKDGSFYNTSPSISPQGDRIAFISNRDDYFDVFIMDAIDGNIIDKLIRGQRTADFEELHLLTPGMSWSPDGKYLTLATKSGDQDAIIIIDVKSGEEQKLEFGLDGIFSVQWSPIDSIHKQGRLAFVGIKGAQSDIFIYDLDTKTLTDLTNDIFTDADPAWSPDGKTIYFSSDRKNFLSPSSVPNDFKIQKFNYSQRDIYSIDVESKKINRLTDLPNSNETSPAVAPDGKHIFFISDMNGINNIYIDDLDSGKIYPRTNSLNGVYQLSLSHDGTKMAFSSLSNAGFDMFLMRNPLDHKVKGDTLEMTEFFRRLTTPPSKPDSNGSEIGKITIGSDVIVKLDTQDTTKVPIEDGRVDLRNYVFNDEFKRKREYQQDSAKSIAIKNNVDEFGNYKVNKYKLNFSPDIIYGNAGYNTLYGIQGSTIMAFSDMLGDHQIYLLLDMILDLKNSDYAIAYMYLPKRIDYGIQAFHTVRFLQTITSNDLNSNVYRFRSYGGSLMASYPIDKFNRLEGNMTLLNLSRDNQTNVDEPIQRRTLLTPSISYVHDNSLWGLIAPANGVRYNLSVLASPKISNNGLSFTTITGDYRQYFRLWKNYTLAIRLAGGGSFGKNPQMFIIGGVDNWINRQFENNSVPLKNAEDFVFLSSGVPLRGYNYGARIGTKYGLLNTEIRFPLFGGFAAGPIPMFLQSFGGVLFLDLGSTWWGWEKQNYLLQYQEYENNPLNRQDVLAGTGYGVRMILLGFLLKMDVAWSYDLKGFSMPKYYFSLGADI